MKKPQIKAFTLVELIIVITILAILATIGFISFQSYTIDARDANRVATVKQMSNGLDIVYTKKAAYPMPDGTVSTGAIGTTVYAYKGTIGDGVSKTLRMEKSLDPSSKEEYVYGVNLDKTQYQIATVLENNTVATSITNTSYADLGTVAKVSGNYPGYLKFSSGSETWIANIPSLLWNNSGSVSLLSASTYFVVNKKTNLPYKLNTNSVLGTKNPNTIIQEITGTGVATLTGVNITGINSSNISSTFSGTLLASFGGDIAKVTSAVVGGSIASSVVNLNTWHTCQNGERAIAMNIKLTTKYYLCRGNRTYPLINGSGKNFVTIQLDTNNWVNPYFESQNGTKYGGIRYEITNVTSTGVNNTSSYWGGQKCTNTSCTSFSGPNGGISTSNPSMAKIQLANLSIDGMEAVNHYSWSNGAGSMNWPNDIYELRGAYIFGTQSFITSDQFMVTYIHNLRLYMTENFGMSGYAINEKIWLEY